MYTAMHAVESGGHGDSAANGARLCLPINNHTCSWVGGREGEGGRGAVEWCSTQGQVPMTLKQ